MTSLSCEIAREGRSLRAKLSGEITEDFDVAPLLAAKMTMDCDGVILDLSGVRRVNSLGVREWIRFLDALRKRVGERRVVLERCSVAIVQQLNMIATFRGTAEVRSIFAPYRCPSCHDDRELLVDVSDPRAVDVPPTIPCEGCGARMEFDDLLDVYISFLR